MKRLVCLVLLLCLALLLPACGILPEGSAAAAVAETPLPTTEPTPEPTPTPTPPPTEWTITDESAEEILALAELPSLERIDATASTEYDALLQLREKLPDCDIRWEYEFQGVRYPSDTTELKVTDMTGLEDALRYLPALTDVDLLEAGAEIEDLDRFSEIRPDVFWLWEFRFHGFVIRTDILVYSSLQPIGFVPHDDAYYYPILKYCTKLKALDLGHNSLKDISPIGKMTDLQILILADDHLTDASCLANLKDLIYLELFMNDELEDFSFLKSLTKLKDLNLCYCTHLTSLDFMDYMPDLEFMLVKYTGLDVDYYNEMKASHPQTRMVFWDGDRESTNSGWRDTPRNHMIRSAFANWPSIVRYDYYNDMDFEFYGKIYPITYYVRED